jgi:hypothetical protein
MLYCLTGTWSLKELSEKSEPLSVNLRDVEQIFDCYVQELEDKAKKSHEAQKWIMFGYYKAMAIHLRKIKRKIRTDIVSRAVGFPTRHEREEIAAKERERLDREREAAFAHPTRREP